MPIKIGNNVIDFVIACEDIREEAGGKHALLGVIKPHIFSAVFPGTIRLSFYIQTTPQAKGDYPFIIRVRSKQKVLARQDGKLSIRIANEVDGIATPPMFVGLEAPGEYFVEASEDDLSWKRIYTLRADIANHTNSLSSDVSPPS